MEATQPELIRLMVVVAAALGVLVYVFLRMAGITRRHGQRDGRPPPPTPLG